MGGRGRRGARSAPAVASSGVFDMPPNSGQLAIDLSKPRASRGARWRRAESDPPSRAEVSLWPD